MIKEYERYHGVAFNRLVHGAGGPVSIKRYNQISHSCYVIDDHIGAFIKYSTKRLSPWSFTFKKEHQDEILKMHSMLKSVFIILVCGEDGIVSLSYDELKLLLDDNHDNYEWVGVWRNAREKYKISGTDGKLEFKIGDNEYPAKLFT